MKNYAHSAPKKNFRGELIIHGGTKTFLAAMSSSRSDVVTKFVRSCVPFFSFSVLEVLSSPKEFQWCFRQFKGCLKFKGSFEDVLKKF